MTYRLAVVSAVHGDVHALEDALRHIDAMGCDAIVCAGDTVDFGRYPNETVALLAKRGIPTVRGNHERWSLDGDYRSSSRSVLTDESRAFLRAALRFWAIEREGSRVEVHHARPGSDMEGIIPPTAHRSGPDLPPLNASVVLRGADVLIAGHTHVAFALRVGDRLIANPGALLRDPVDANSPPAPGTFGMLELPARTWRVYRAADGAEVELARTP